MRGAIVGYGFIATQGHGPAYRSMDDVEIVAVADITAERRQLAERDLPGVRTYACAEELLEAERDLDFVDIATPPSLHTPVALQALEGGVAVLCEKPLACTSVEVLQMMDAARRNHTVLFPVHNYKHAPVVKRLREICDSGQLGTPRSCTLSTFRTTHARGVPEWLPDWRRHRRWSGGGIAMDHGSHSFYLTFAFMGGYPRAVTASAFRHDVTFDTDDSMTCTLRFDNGFAHVYLSWAAGVRKVCYSIQGDRGAVFVDEDQLQIGAGSEVRVDRICSSFDDASHVSWFGSLFRQFQAALEHRDGAAEQELIDAYYCVRVIEKIAQSAARSSLELPIDPQLAAAGFDRLPPAPGARVAERSRARSLAGRAW